MNLASSRIAALGPCIALVTGGVASASPRPTLVVGGDHEYPPYEYLENGEPTGFDVELMREAAAIAGFDVEFRLGPWARARRDLEEGKVDALPGMYWSAERTQLVDFSVPHTMVRSAIFVRQDSPIRSFADLRGKEVILQEGDVRYDFFRRTGLASRIVAVTHAGEQLRHLASGRGDCALMTSRLQGEYFVKRLGLKGLRAVDADLPQLRYCFAVRKGNRELLYRLDEGLNVLKHSGKYREIYERWFGVYERPDLRTYGRHLAVALAGLAALLAANLLWSRSLRRQVRVRTAELRRAKDELEQRVEARTADLQRASDELRASEAEKALILNSMGEVVVFLDPEMNIQWGNRAAVALARTGLDGLKGRHCWEAFFGRGERCQGCPVSLAMADGEPHSTEMSGEGKQILHRAYPVTDAQGRLLGAAAFILDITERKRTEEALRESEEWLKLTVEATGAGTLHTVPFGPPALSPRFREMLGIPDDFVIDGFESFLRLVHPEDREMWRGSTLKALDPSGDGRVDRIGRFRRPDGSVRWLQGKTKVQFAGVGGELRAVRLATVAVDVTDRKREEEALRESEARARAILASLAEGIVLHDAEGRTVSANQAAQELLGRSIEEMAGRTVLDGPPPLQLDGSAFPRDEHPVMLALRTGSGQGGEFGMRRPDGSLVWLAAHAQPVRLPDGKVAGVVCSLFDVTQRRQALQRSEGHLRTLADSVPDGIVRFDRSLRILFANQAVAAAIGLPADRFVGKTREELERTSERAADFDQHLLRLFRTGSPDEFEYVYEPGGGQCEVRLIPERGTHGEIESVLAIMRDITERKRAERHLLASREQLRELVARLNAVREEEKARLSRELHDEMGQLLTALGMELEVLEDRLADLGMPAAVRDLVDRAVAASELVAKTVQSMRSVLSSLRPLALDRLGLDAALRQECRRFEEWAGIPCDFAAADGVSTFGAEADTALFRIAQEALTNVARHAGASRAAVRLEWTMGEALLQVEDDGRGIPAGRESTGLGLLGMRERAERLGGHLTVKPGRGGGTTVEARIPSGAPTGGKDAS